jgi:hypothetical protein
MPQHLLRRHPCYTNGGHCDCPRCSTPAGDVVAAWSAVCLVVSAALWIAGVHWLGPWLAGVTP